MDLGRRLCVIGGVLVDEPSLVRWDLFVGKDRVSRAHRNASAAVDAAVGVNIQLGRSLELLFVFLGVDAVGRASFHAEFVFGTGISDGVSHDCDSPIWCGLPPSPAAVPALLLPPSLYKFGNQRGGDVRHCPVVSERT